MRLLKACATVAAMLAAISSTQASELIECSPKDGEYGIVTLALSDGRFEGTELSCLYADFVYDMSPCAPRGGGFGMSYPTGAASLRALGTRWQDYLDHSGGVVGHGINAKSMSFAGGFHFPESDFKWKWEIEISRITGKGQLTIDGKSYGYECRTTTRRF